MNKKLLACIAALLCAVLLMPALHADVIWEPYGNRFYEKHSAECIYLDKSYIVSDGTQGYDAPGGDKPVWTIEGDQWVYIGFAYEDSDGVLWGVSDVYTDDGWITFWIILDDEEPVYDSRDFIAEHKDSLTDYADELENLEPKGSLTLWSYPGSSEYEVLPLDSDFDHTWAELVFTDEYGCAWVYYSYLFGMEGWVYQPDPMGTDPVAITCAAPESQSASHLPSVSLTLLIGLVAGGVLFVVAISAVLIGVLYGAKKRKK